MRKNKSYLRLTFKSLIISIIVILIHSTLFFTSFQVVAKENLDINYEYDDLGRVVFDSSKKSIVCPKDNDELGVIYFAGQSNAGNHAKYLVKQSDVPDVVLFYNGKCYSATSPVLGGSNSKGEFNTLIAQNLVNAGLFSRVIIANTSVGSSSIHRWLDPNDISSVFVYEYSLFKRSYEIDFLVWIHGESDNRANTPVSIYTESFKELIDLLEISSDTNIGITLNTHCLDYAIYKDNIKHAYNEIISNAEYYDLGILNTLDNSFRKDKCHFNKRGQIKASDIISERLIEILVQDS